MCKNEKECLYNAINIQMKTSFQEGRELRWGIISSPNKKIFEM